ncbi:MAG: methyltransferase family protein, partial [Candidatus Dormibacteraceae bacterium]
FWLGAAIWYAVRLDGSPGGKVMHFLKTVFPEPVLLLLIPLAFILIGLVPASFWSHLTLVQPVIQIVGITLLVVCTIWIIWARIVLAEMWAGRPMLQTEHQLRTEGPYRITRHPIYSSLIGMFLGTTLVIGFGSLLALLIGALLMVAWRIPVEERMMISIFGDRYLQYRQQVPTLIPSPLRLFNSTKQA